MKIASPSRGLAQALGLAAALYGACGDALRAAPPVPAAAFFNAPLRFEANRGQAPAPIQFLARGGAGSLLLAPTATTLYARPGAAPGEVTPPWCQVRVALIDANPGASLEGLDPAPARVNYLTGSDPRQWHTQIPTFARVKASGVYPGVDLVYYGRGGQIEYDFNVRPGGDPTAIRLGFEGVEGLAIDAAGNLVVRTPAGGFLHRRPVAYQVANGVRTGIAAAFTLAPAAAAPSLGPRVAGFELGAYNPALPLVIDPVLSFASYLGGSGDDQAYGVAVDSQGCIYVTGQTTSPDFPATKALAPKISGQYDVFVTKFSADGQEIIYSTFVGGSANDRGFNLALDSTGAAVVAGQTSSPDFPTKNAFQPFFVGGDRDAFLFKLAPDGASFVFSTYLGGGASDDLTCVAVDRADNILAGGGTSSTNFPVLRAFQSENHGGYDAVLVRCDPAGVLNYSTYLGGSGPYDTAIGVAVDQEQCPYLTGYTSSRDFPLRNPLQATSAGGYDAFITKFNPSGSGLVFSTLLGGGADDVGRGIAVDALGNTYIAGDTFSTNFPTVKPLQPANAGLRDVFVCKISPTGLTLLFSTFFWRLGRRTRRPHRRSRRLRLAGRPDHFHQPAPGGSHSEPLRRRHLGRLRRPVVAGGGPAGFLLLSRRRRQRSRRRDRPGPLGQRLCRRRLDLREPADRQTLPKLESRRPLRRLRHAPFRNRAIRCAPGGDRACAGAASLPLAADESPSPGGRRKTQRTRRDQHGSSRRVHHRSASHTGDRSGGHPRSQPHDDGIPGG